jgi:hypothetical protein
MQHQISSQFNSYTHPGMQHQSVQTGGKFVVADQKIAGRNKAHCIYIQNKAES